MTFCAVDRLWLAAIFERSGVKCPKLEIMVDKTPQCFALALLPPDRTRDGGHLRGGFLQKVAVTAVVLTIVGDDRAFAVLMADALEPAGRWYFMERLLLCCTNKVEALTHQYASFGSHRSRICLRGISGSMRLVLRLLRAI